MTLDKKILGGLVGCTLVLLFVAVISFNNSEKFVETNQWINHTHEVLYEFDQILISSVDAETGARGFVITGDTSYLEPFNSARSKLLFHIKTVRELTRDNSAQQENLTKIEKLANKHLEHLDRKIALRKKDFQKAEALVATGQGKRIEDEIRKLINHSKTIEQELLITRRENSQEDIRNFNLIFTALLITITLGLISVYIIITANLKALRKAEAENASKTWSLSASGELIKSMQGNKLLVDLGQTIINHLTSYLDAHVGAIYLADENELTLRVMNSYAIDKVDADLRVIKFGEGLVGQAAVEKRNILLEDIPPGYFILHSSFGEILPKSIMAVPVIFEDRVVAVIELGSVKKFSEFQKKYLSTVVDSIAVTIVSSHTRAVAKELLEETQRQSEELEAQQRELKQTNEELLRIQMDITAQNNIINSVAIVSRADVRGDITYVNDQFIKWSKYTKEEVMGKNHRFLKSGDQPAEIFVDLWKTISGGRIWRGELKNRAKDGTFYWVDAIIAPVLDHNGKPKEYIAQRFVINEKKQREEEMKELLEETQRQSEELEVQQEALRQTNDELMAKANLLEEQKENLALAKEEIETKAREVELANKYKSEFLANMSHELRTPLNSILILAQLISENKNNTVGQKEVDFAKNIFNSGTDLLELINEILDLSKVEAGKMQLDIGEAPFQQIATHLTAMFSEMAKNKSIDFKISYNEKDLPAAMTTDIQRVEQVLRNLLSNAFKFTSEGGQVTVTIDKPISDLSFENKYLTKASSVVAFSVSDTGIGIPKEKLSIIFEAFQQADGSNKRKYGGTGLGLSISRELAFALGGEIQLSSEEGKGSTFSLYLPLHFDSSFTFPIDKKIEVSERKTEKKIKPASHMLASEISTNDDRHHIQENDRVVLIIEDDESFANVLLDFIRSRGYKGVIASQGNTGVSYARHYRPDAILLDIMLPVMDGVEVLKQIKNDPDLRHIPVQIISAYDQKNEGKRLGAFDYIKKPVTIHDLQKAFDNLQAFANKKLKKLLIVEDNETQNIAIKELIGNGDVRCFSAFRGAEAYETLEHEPFDCIIIDLGLPDMSGFELLEKIKASNKLNRIPIVVYTGRVLKKEDNERLSKLADAVVLKTADSHERLLDETILFLHRVESRLPKEKQTMIRKLHHADEVLKNKKVLLVDDDIRNIFSLTNALEEEGLYCLTAENGKVALQVLKENPAIDLILMDIMMPQMDGYETTLEIRRMNEFSKLPIIALTAKAMKGDKEKCLSVGMSDYISKPVNVEQLLSLMRVWLYR